MDGQIQGEKGLDSVWWQMGGGNIISVGDGSHCTITRQKYPPALAL